MPLSDIPVEINIKTLKQCKNESFICISETPIQLGLYYIAPVNQTPIEHEQDTKIIIYN